MILARGASIRGALRGPPTSCNTHLQPTSSKTPPSAADILVFPQSCRKFPLKSSLGYDLSCECLVDDVHLSWLQVTNR